MVADERWQIVPKVIDASMARDAREAVWPLIADWITKLLDYPGFREWKNESLKRKLLFAAWPQVPSEPLHDFVFDKITLERHALVSGYNHLVSAALDCRAVTNYLRRYPFRNLSITR